MKNYQLELDKITEKIKAENVRPALLLHACCAPCSSYVLEYLTPYFDITLYFYNPNISSREEYDKRYEELLRLTREMPLASEVKVLCAAYDNERFAELSCGREELAEGGARCYDCYRLRLSSAARAAKDGGFDYFATTLSISPHKRADWLNEIGEELSVEAGVKYLPSDFKKRGGYRRSCELSREYGLYRQNFCGCEFSHIEAEKRKHGTEE